MDSCEYCDKTIDGKGAQKIRKQGAFSMHPKLACPECVLKLRGDVTRVNVALAVAEEVLLKVGFIEVRVHENRVEGVIEVPLLGASGSRVGVDYTLSIEYNEDKDYLVVMKNGWERIQLGDPQIEEKLTTDVRRAIAQDIERDGLPYPAVLDQYLGWFVEYHRAMKKIIEEGEKIPTKRRWEMR